MSKVFISFLGTNDYLACNYDIKEQDPVHNVRFVQEACIVRWCTEWTSDDRIFICTTEESHRKNWLDNGHTDRDGKIGARQGLESRLRELSFPAPFAEVVIPSGRSEHEIWDIFERVFALFQEGDELYLDITHAFRSLPMLALVIISYAKVMRKIKVRAVSYGAMEVLGSLPEVRAMHIEDRMVPVFDLLPFARLQDWVIAVDRFTSTGDANLLGTLAEMEMRPIIKASGGQEVDAVSIKKLGQDLKKFSETLSTCRSRNITARVQAVKNSLDKIQDVSFSRVLQPLLHTLEPALASFQGEEITDGLAAADWCLKHQLYQQGYTILSETMVTFVVNSALGTDGRDRKERELVNQCGTIIDKDLPESKWKHPASEDISKTQRMIDWLRPQRDLLESLKNLAEIRNDLNHAGQTWNPSAPQTIREKLSKHIEKMQEVFVRNATDVFLR